MILSRHVPIREGNRSVSKKAASYLRLHAADSDSIASDQPVSSDFNIDTLMDCFTRATGWMPMPQGRAPHARPGGVHAGDKPRVPPLAERVRLVCTEPIDGALEDEPIAPVVPQADAWALLEQIDGLIQQLHGAEERLEEQEAQLATAVGVSISRDEARLLGDKLKDTLHRAAAQTGSDAAAIYLLDETTSQLKLRSAWGMSASRLSQPARPLRGALADLEALMGNAVLIENTALAPEWNCPEPFTAGMCLPIGSPTMPQGTLWLWSDHVRDFSSLDIEVARLAADKILVEIERCVLADEVVSTRRAARDAEQAGHLQASRLPSNQPLHADYEIGGWSLQTGDLGGCFHTWTLTPKGLIAAGLGAAESGGAVGALVAASVQTVLETCWNSPHRPSQVLRRANDILWEAQDGDWRSSLAYLLAHPESGSIQIAAAGAVRAFIVGRRGFRPIRSVPTLLAEQPDTRFYNEQLCIEGGDLLVIASPGTVAGPAAGGITENDLLQAIRTMEDEPVEEIADALARMLPVNAPTETARDRGLLVLRRRF
ncbi:MAG: hypothetical protein D6753_12705 [Planctomycetota bacterium]|nr:MAG: hypothetical protein D6753_12705 [Planctomycetota bacterium]